MHTDLTWVSAQESATRKWLSCQPRISIDPDFKVELPSDHLLEWADTKLLEDPPRLSSSQASGPSCRPRAKLRSHWVCKRGVPPNGHLNKGKDNIPSELGVPQYQTNSCSWVKDDSGQCNI